MKASGKKISKFLSLVVFLVSSFLFSINVFAEKMYIKPKPRWDFEGNKTPYVVETYDDEEFTFKRENEPIGEAIIYNDVNGKFTFYKNGKQLCRRCHNGYGGYEEACVKYCWNDGVGRLRGTLYAEEGYKLKAFKNVDVGLPVLSCFIRPYSQYLEVIGAIPPAILAYVIDRNLGFVSKTSYYEDLKIKAYEKERIAKENEEKERIELELKKKQIQQYRFYIGKVNSEDEHNYMAKVPDYEARKYNGTQFKKWLKDGNYDPDFKFPENNEQAILQFLSKRIGGRIFVPNTSAVGFDSSFLFRARRLDEDERKSYIIWFKEAGYDPNAPIIEPDASQIARTAVRHPFKTLFSAAKGLFSGH